MTENEGRLDGGPVPKHETATRAARSVAVASEAALIVMGMRGYAGLQQMNDNRGGGRSTIDTGDILALTLAIGTAIWGIRYLMTRSDEEHRHSARKSLLNLGSYTLVAAALIGIAIGLTTGHTNRGWILAVVAIYCGAATVLRHIRGTNNQSNQNDQRPNTAIAAQPPNCEPTFGERPIPNQVARAGSAAMGAVAVAGFTAWLIFGAFGYTAAPNSGNGHLFPLILGITFSWIVILTLIAKAAIARDVTPDQACDALAQLAIILTASYGLGLGMANNVTSPTAVYVGLTVTIAALISRAIFKAIERRTEDRKWTKAGALSIWDSELDRKIRTTANFVALVTQEDPSLYDLTQIYQALYEESTTNTAAWRLSPDHDHDTIEQTIANHRRT